MLASKHIRGPARPRAPRGRARLQAHSAPARPRAPRQGCDGTPAPPFGAPPQAPLKYAVAAARPVAHALCAPSALLPSKPCWREPVGASLVGRALCSPPTDAPYGPGGVRHISFAPAPCATLYPVWGFAPSPFKVRRRSCKASGACLVRTLSSTFLEALLARALCSPQKTRPTFLPPAPDANLSRGPYRGPRARRQRRTASR